MLLCLTAIAMSGPHSLYAQSSKSDFMSDNKSLFEEVTGIKKKTDKAKLAKLEEMLYGTDGDQATEPTLPMPEKVLELLKAAG